MNCDNCDAPKNSLRAAEIGFGVDQVVRHQRLLFGLTQALLTAFSIRATGAVLVLSQFAHAAHTAVAQVIDVVNFTAAIAQVNQNLDDRQDVPLVNTMGPLGSALPILALNFMRPTRQIVGVGVVEQALEQRPARRLP